MDSATIRLFLPKGDAKSLRTAEIINWTGFAIAAPRTEIDDLLSREELDRTGVYILSGVDPATGNPRAYIGEAELANDGGAERQQRLERWLLQRLLDDLCALAHLGDAGLVALALILG